MKISLISLISVISAGNVGTWEVCVDDSSCAIATDKCCDAVSKTLGT